MQLRTGEGDAPGGGDWRALDPGNRSLPVEIVDSKNMFADASLLAPPLAIKLWTIIVIVVIVLLVLALLGFMRR